MGVVEVTSVNWHDAGADFVETYLDMSGPHGEMYRYQSLLNLCLVVEPDSTLNEEIKNSAVQKAPLTVEDQLGEAMRSLTPAEYRVFELRPVDPTLPRVVYIWCVHSPQAMSGSPSAFCTATYGLTDTSPRYLHPNEILEQEGIVRHSPRHREGGAIGPGGRAVPPRPARRADGRAWRSGRS